MNNIACSVNWGKNYFKFLLTGIFIALLLLLAVPGPMIENAAAKVQPVLMNLAVEEPDSVVEVIVQKTTSSDNANLLAQNLGAVVTKDLHILNAFAAQIPADAVIELAQSPEINWISFDGPVMKGNDSNNPDTFSLRSDFNDQTFGNAWIELGENDGPQLGDVAIVNFLGGALTGLRIQGAEKGIQGQFNLPNALDAVLSIGYRRKGLEAEAEFVGIEISNDGGSSWTEVERLAGPATDPNLMFLNLDITPFLADDILVRFVSSATFDPLSKFYLDYVQIDYLAEQEKAQILPYAEMLSIDGVTLGEAALEPDSLAASTVDAKTVRDEFNLVAWDNNDGTEDWTSIWDGYDYGGGGPSGGYVYVQNGRMVFHYTYAYEEYAFRTADLTGSTQATLTFDWQTIGLDYNETISVLVSKGGDHPFVELDQFGGSQTGSASYDISAYISHETTIRIENRSSNWEYGEYAKFDNVQIAHLCAECIDTTNLDNTYVQAIKADLVWNEAPFLQGQGVTVAVVDSGIAEHIDLADESGNSRILTHVQFMTDNSSPDDLYGHGTHVAGSIAGNGSQSNGIFTGVAPKANLVDVKVIDDHGAGYTSDVVAGIQWIYENHETYNIRVVNLSLNSATVDSYHESPLDAALEILWFNGLTVVVSVGNNGNGPDGYLYAPANDPFFIAVGATDDMDTVDKSDDILASFSAHGNAQGGAQKPELLTPGVDIISLLASDDSNLALEHPTHTVIGPDGNTYFRMSGTSMSSAVASGAVALLLQDEPGLNPDQVKYRLMNTGSHFATPTPGPTSVSYLDILAAINGTTTATANTGIQASELLWTGSDPITWGSVNWGSVNWGSVNWGSVNWGSVNWGSVNWGSVNWGS